MAMGWKFTWVDVFAETSLAGNPLCVFTQADEMPHAMMERLTVELRQSETAFLQRPTVSTADGRVRVFIPTGSGAVEIPFAGHPLLGSACALMQHRREACTVTLETGVGLVSVAVTPLGAHAWEARMSQPLPQLVWSRGTEGMAEALGLTPADVRTDLPMEAMDNGMPGVLIPLASPEAVDRCQPDLQRLRDRLGWAGMSTMVFALGGQEPESDVHCRAFSPFDAVTEDPATGSVNGPLGEYLVRHRLVAGPTIRSEQGDQMGRPSRIQIEVEERGGRVSALWVGGRVRRVGAGEFLDPQEMT